MNTQNVNINNLVFLKCVHATSLSEDVLAKLQTGSGANTWRCFY
jgi:hypothetical protein